MDKREEKLQALESEKWKVTKGDGCSWNLWQVVGVWMVWLLSLCPDPSLHFPSSASLVHKRSLFQFSRIFAEFLGRRRHCWWTHALVWHVAPIILAQQSSPGLFLSGIFGVTSYLFPHSIMALWIHFIFQGLVSVLRRNLRTEVCELCLSACCERIFGTCSPHMMTCPPALRSGFLFDVYWLNECQLLSNVHSVGSSFSFTSIQMVWSSPFVFFISAS